MRPTLIFATDPDSDEDTRLWRLDLPCLPYETERIITKQTEGCVAYFPPRTSPWWNKHEKPLITWMLDFIQFVKDIVPSEAPYLTFEFRSYIKVYTSTNMEDEWAIRCSPPLWFLTIKDDQDRIVHKNWTLAIDEGGDIEIKRGTVTEEDHILKGEHYLCEWARPRIRSAIESHLLLNSLRRQRKAK